MSTLRAAAVPGLARPAAYLALTKPDVSLLVVITTLAGFYLGSRVPVDTLRMAYTVFGTSLIAGGTSALNHYFERASDACMRRTASRPLPSGQLQPAEALWFGVGLVTAGTIYLFLAVSALPSLLALGTCVSYLGAYTPLKRRTTLATLVGAFPGAVPPLIGWAAARGTLSREAWILYAVMFLWQFPHFLAIAWMYREDYARAGIRMLPVVDRSGKATFAQILFTAIALVPVSLLPAVIGEAGARYFFGALVLGLGLVEVSLW
ncbi:MAG TPA: heme o synthase, partial [Candidatus Acidoferrales bacterium]|nr:heme o synthase [Candidatus Acidoferrales bacterium]